MLVAYRKNGARFNLTNVKNRESLFNYRTEQFYCPECGERLLLKIGNKRIPHFAHQRSSSCSEKYERESEYHLSGKLSLYNWLNKCGLNPILEPFDANCRQRPDIMVHYNGLRYAIEYQCSVISEELFTKRTKTYLENSIIPLWILGGNQLKRKKSNLIKATNFQLFFTVKQNKQTIISTFCPNVNQFIFLYDLLPISSQNFISRFKFYSLETCTFEKVIFPTLIRDFSHVETWRNELQRLKKQMLFVPNARKNPFIQELYTHGLNLLLLPPELGLPVQDSIYIETPPLVWQSYLFIDILSSLGPGGVLTMPKVCSALNKRFFQKDIKLRTLPLMRCNFIQPVIQYIKLLEKLNYLQSIDQQSFRVLRKLTLPLNSYSHLVEENRFYKDNHHLF